MEGKVQIENSNSESKKNLYRRIKIVLYSEDFDFAQSFSLYFRKDFQKIVTVNDRETFLQIVKTLQPEIIVIDITLNVSTLKLIEEVKSTSSNSKIFVFTSHPIIHQELVNQVQKQVDKVFYQPIDLVEFNQVLNFYTAD
jgi:ActR/RegA family two-component response regulator